MPDRLATNTQIALARRTSGLSDGFVLWFDDESGAFRSRAVEL